MILLWVALAVMGGGMKATQLRNHFTSVPLRPLPLSWLLSLRTLTQHHHQRSVRLKVSNLVKCLRAQAPASAIAAIALPACA